MAHMLTKIGSTGGDSDPCLFMGKNKFGVCYIATDLFENAVGGREKDNTDEKVSLENIIDVF